MAGPAVVRAEQESSIYEVEVDREVLSVEELTRAARAGKPDGSVTAGVGRKDAQKRALVSHALQELHGSASRLLTDRHGI
jgi:hypothetical protein